MDRPPSFGFNFESIPESEEDLRDTTGQARKIGAFARVTLGKRGQKEKEQAEEDTKKIEKKQEKPSKDKEKDTSNKSEKNENPRIESLKRRALKEQLETNIPKLEAELAATKPETPEHAAALAALVVETRLKYKVENPEIETDPLIDEEFDRRMANLPESETELLEIIGEEAPKPLEVPTDELKLQEEALTRPVSPIPTALHPSPESQPSGGDQLAPETPKTSTSPVISDESSANYGGYSPTSSAEDSPISATPQSPTNPNSYPAKPVEHPPEQTKGMSSFAVSGLFEKLVSREEISVQTPELAASPQTLQSSPNPEAVKRHLMNREEELKQAVQTAVAEGNTKTRENTVSPVARTPVAEILRQTIVAPKNEITPVRQSPETPEQLTSKTPEAQAAGEARPTRKNESIVKNIEQLSTPQILRAAEAIVISGISVRKLYETNQIDRKGLIHIVKEKLRGRSVKQALEKVIIGRERQKERAIEMRHDDPGFAGASDQPNQPISASAASATLQVLPNSPDPSSMQPINPDPIIVDTDTQSVTASLATSSVPRKKGYAVNIAIAITSLMLLLAWLFL